jgi:HEPN domain-containing protein
MSDDVKAGAECYAVDVIYESFVITGDQDYLMARMLALKGFHRGFFWAAAQAIEKYLKAFLLMNGHPVKHFNHSIKKSYDFTKDLSSDLVDLDISRHNDIQVDSNVVNHIKNFTILEYINELETHGASDNRYNASGVVFNTGHLFALDALVFNLRKKIEVPPIFESFNKLNPEMLIFLNKLNPWFQIFPDKNEVPTQDFPIQYISYVTKLEFIKEENNKNDPKCYLALKWLKTKMKIS